MHIMCPVCKGYESYTPYRLGTECTFFDCSKGTECALCAQSVKGMSLIPLTDWAQNAHSLTVQRGQNAHYVPSL